MEKRNITRAKIAMCLGILTGLSVPYLILADQKQKQIERKKNIYVDRERMRQKLESNPDLKFKTKMDVMPVNIEEFTKNNENR